MSANWGRMIWMLAVAGLCAASTGARPAPGQTASASSSPAQTSPEKGSPTTGGLNPFSLREVRTYWNSEPTVGTGAVYEVTSANGKKSTQEYELLTEEVIDGKKAYWLEVAGENPPRGQMIYVKWLVIPSEFQTRKQIIQIQGGSAMSVPLGPPPNIPTADANEAKVTGTESITVPGGTFLCEHWREKNGTEAWVSANVAPLKAVKIVERNQTWVLTKMISHAKDYITGPVKPFNPEVLKNQLAQ